VSEISHEFEARYASECNFCLMLIDQGDLIRMTPDGAMHADCAEEWADNV
jgi:hypothetical protein